MTANTSSTPDDPGGPGGCRCSERVPVVGTLDRDTVDPEVLAGLLDDLAAVNRLMARVIAVTGQVARSGITETVEGMPLDLVLANVARLTGADRHTILTAADVLGRMPVVAGLFATGRLSWGQVRGIVAAVRRRSVGFQGQIDTRVGVTVTELGGTDRMDPDQLVAAVEDAVSRLEDEERAATAAADGADVTVAREDRVESFLALQMGFDGAGTVYGQFDPVSMGIVVNALDLAAALPTSTTTSDTAGTTGDDRDDAINGTGVDGLDRPRWSTRSRSRQHARALIDIAARSLSGDPTGGKPAKPLIVAHVDITDVTTSQAGTIEIALRGLPTTISLATLDQLACDATLRTVLFDGATPLAVAERTRAVTIPTPTRIAVGARDAGDRFPASTAPIAWCDLHHIRERASGGTHHPANLLALSRRTHRLVHHHGWTITRTPDSDRVDVVAFDHPGGRRLYSTPTTTRLLPHGPPSTGPPRDPPATRPPNQDAPTPPAHTPDTANQRQRRHSDATHRTGREPPDDPNDETDDKTAGPDLPF